MHCAKLINFLKRAVSGIVHKGSFLRAYIHPDTVAYTNFEQHHASYSLNGWSCCLQPPLGDQGTLYKKKVMSKHKCKNYFCIC